MKKLIAFGAVLVVLLSSLIIPTEVTMKENSGIQVCSDLDLPDNPFD